VAKQCKSTFFFGVKGCGNIDYEQTNLLQKSSALSKASRFSTTCGGLAKITKGISKSTFDIANIDTLLFCKKKKKKIIWTHYDKNMNQIH
jgi:hypothetical protein